MLLPSLLHAAATTVTTAVTALIACNMHCSRSLDLMCALSLVQALPESARSLLLRLLLRKRRWYAISGVAYAEVPDVPAAAAALRAAGLVAWSSDAEADLHSLLPELPVAMLKAVLAKVLPRNHPAMVGGNGAAASGVEGKAALVNSIQVRPAVTCFCCAVAGHVMMGTASSRLLQCAHAEA